MKFAMRYIWKPSGFRDTLNSVIEPFIIKSADWQWLKRVPPEYELHLNKRNG